jgi:hypothetical protein
MELPSYFSDFMSNIRPSSEERKQYQDAHRELREKLMDDDDLKEIIVTTFLQGSYRRSTILRPELGEHADVDVVVVTKISKEDTTPEQALKTFVPFLEKNYQGQFELQGRSIGITLDDVDLDLVATSAPSESQVGILKSSVVSGDGTLEEWLGESWISLGRHYGEFSEVWLAKAQEEGWKLEPLDIPDREARIWKPTHPLEQIRWTHEKNGLTNGHYIHVVKAIKEWKRVNKSLPRYPKGYPLEHLIGACCPDGITYTAEGVVQALETIKTNFAKNAANRTTPVLPDHGVPEHDVMQRVTGAEFAAFHFQVCEAANVARDALDADSVEESAKLWRQLFGDNFPAPPSGGGDNGGGGPGSQEQSAGFTPRTAPTIVTGGRFG